MRRPAVAIDSRRLFASGIGRYTSGLVSALTELHTQGRIRLILFASQDATPSVGELVTYDEPLLTSWSQSNLAKLVRDSGADIFVAPQYYTAPQVGIPCIRVLHDAHPFWETYSSPSVATFESTYGRDNLQRLGEDAGCEWNPSGDPDDSSVAQLIRAMYSCVSEAASALVTVSHFSANDLTQFLPRTVGRWTVLYPFVADTIASESVLRRRRQSRRLLLVSKLEPRKRQVETIEAVATLRRSSGLDLRLTLVGGATASFPAYARQVTEFVAEHGEWVDRVENIADRELAERYSSATLTIFPSESEGFGYPAVESLAMGTPVLVPDNSSLPEVVGEAGYVYQHGMPLADAILDGWLRASSDGRSAASRRKYASRFSREVFREGLLESILAIL